MPEKIEELVRAAIAAAQQSGELPEFEVTELGFERPADSANGDWSSTVAMRSAKLARRAPRQIAEAIVSHIAEDASVERVEVAGPGFINFYLAAASANEVFRTVREQGRDYARSQLGAGTKVQVEFVSANPVGPLHIGHGRWAALGDSLCRVLEHAGYEVQREYYINDHGSQMDVFGHSVSMRYRQLLDVMAQGEKDLDAARAALLADREAYVADEDDSRPETHPLTDAFNEALGGNAYGGDYIVDIACRFVREDGDRWAGVPEDERMAEFRERGYRWMLDSIRQTCHEARCDFDVWFSERSLYEKDASGTSAVDRALSALGELGHLYHDEAGALWFRSTTFGDDKDRVLIKTNGEYTYFASDVAYHWNKFQRVDHVIDIWGADHHGYIQRVQSACEALGYPTQFEVLLGQLVNLLRDGNPVRMSKRKGTMVTFDELLAEVGADATRYTLISKSSNQMIDFDIERVKKQDNTNPVYYVQYAHARICSILRRGADVTLEEAAGLGMDEVARRAVGDGYDLGLLTQPAEAALARKLSELPGLVESCARDRAPFRLTHYAEELAAEFHSFYAACQVLPGKGRPLDDALSHARLAAVDATRRVLALTLELIGVSAPQSM
ncbi:MULTISPECIES: arginine--tRNA ligase [Atopobiaceae]|uniref:arginine--tRNA ligase n=1 Tax=Atopobiaceae TaxID=1643824 RepID=UPI000B38E5B5|nr:MULTISPECIES: arginine--tRNA ligase [Atopobiaceae]MCR8908772.1 arginine--tRNA ligase [Thermophilibacter sp. ET337]OUO31928.1 arginine--tRNA ligase [Olsenella sp. An293]